MPRINGDLCIGCAGSLLTLYLATWPRIAGSISFSTLRWQRIHRKPRRADQDVRVSTRVHVRKKHPDPATTASKATKPTSVAALPPPGSARQLSRRPRPPCPSHRHARAHAATAGRGAGDRPRTAGWRGVVGYTLLHRRKRPRGGAQSVKHVATMVNVVVTSGHNPSAESLNPIPTH